MLSTRRLSVEDSIGSPGRVKTQAIGAISVLTWDGLRGGISVAMALSEDYSRSLILKLTYCVVVFSIPVQGLTVGRVIRMTGGSSMDPPSSSEA